MKVENFDQNSELIRGEFQLVARNAKIPQRSLKKLTELYQEKKIVFMNDEKNVNAIMTFGPRTKTEVLLDAEIAFLNCVVHKKPKISEKDPVSNDIKKHNV